MRTPLIADTTDVEPAVTITVDRIQVRTIVDQVPAINTAILVVRPPVPDPGRVERTAVVVAACNWAKRCFVGSGCRDFAMVW